MSSRRINIVDASLSAVPEIAPWLWAIQDTRQRTMEELNGISPSAVDWLPPDGESAIGTVLYHLAAIEADWLYVEVLEQPFPPDVVALFPYEIRDGQGRLLQVQGVSLAEHLE